MMMPGSASWTPASHDPDLSLCPLGRYVVVFSPRYHTLPWLSWAKKSAVRSRTVLPCLATSLTTRVVMPSATTFVRDVTLTVSVWVCPSLVPLYTHVLPTGRG